MRGKGDMEEGRRGGVKEEREGGRFVLCDKFCAAQALALRDGHLPVSADLVVAEWADLAGVATPTPTRGLSRPE